MRYLTSQGSYCGCGVASFLQQAVEGGFVFQFPAADQDTGIGKQPVTTDVVLVQVGIDNQIDVFRLVSQFIQPLEELGLPAIPVSIITRQSPGSSTSVELTGTSRIIRLSVSCTRVTVV